MRARRPPRPHPARARRKAALAALNARAADLARRELEVREPARARAAALRARGKCGLEHPRHRPAGRTARLPALRIRGRALCPGRSRPPPAGPSRVSLGLGRRRCAPARHRCALCAPQRGLRHRWRTDPRARRAPARHAWNSSSSPAPRRTAAAPTRASSVPLRRRRSWSWSSGTSVPPRSAASSTARWRSSLRRGAQLKHYRLQELSTRTTAFDTLTASIGQDASYRLHAIAIGGQSARSTLTLRLAGERAALALAVVALGDAAAGAGRLRPGRARRPARTHDASCSAASPPARSRVAFNGKVVVAREAAAPTRSQSLRGLLAGPEAEIDVRPQLEIYTDEVRAQPRRHGRQARREDAVLPAVARHRPRQRAAAAQVGVPRGRGRQDRSAGAAPADRAEPCRPRSRTSR